MRQSKGCKKSRELDIFRTPPAIRKPQKINEDQPTIVLRDLSPLPHLLHNKNNQNEIVFQLVETPFPAPKRQLDQLVGVISQIITFQDHSQEQNASEHPLQSQFSMQSVSQLCEEGSEIIEPKPSNDIPSQTQNHEPSCISTQKKTKPPLLVEDKKVMCNCKKTKCLKLYCDCFRDDKVCSEGCNCVGCHNNQQHQEERINARFQVIERDQNGFQPKINLNKEYHSKGCNCKKSNCSKKYCQCYQAGIACGDLCKCEQCKNKEKTNENKKNQATAKKEVKYTELVMGDK